MAPAQFQFCNVVHGSVSTAKALPEHDASIPWVRATEPPPGGGTR
jgi:hypothetical protein